MGIERGEGPRGVGAQTQKKWGCPKGWGPEWWRPEGWGGPKVGAPNFELFFPSPAPVFVFVSL